MPDRDHDLDPGGDLDRGDGADPFDEFDPAPGTRSYLRWAGSHGAESLGEAYDLLDQFEVGNDIPEVLGHDDTVDAIRADLEVGLEVSGPDTPTTALR